MLYKKDSKGKIRIRNGWTENNVLFQETGLLNGSLVVATKVCEGKNIGKSNETTGAEQAILELESRLKKKIDEGYATSIDQATSQKVLLPMLATSYDKACKHINYKKDVFVQRKYDGMRCLAIVEDGKVTLLSRKNQQINTIPHIEQKLSTRPNGVYDGELFQVGKTFQELMSLIKKQQEDSKLVGFFIYDIVEEEKPFKERMLKLINLPFDGTTIVLAGTVKVKSKADIDVQHKLYLSEGYEGTIIRHGDWGYALDKRHKQLIKYKDFQDEMFELVDIVSAEVHPEQGIAVMKTKDGTIFRGQFKLSHQQREEVLKNKEKYIGTMVECRFFEYTTSDNPVPRFPVVLLRLDK